VILAILLLGYLLSETFRIPVSFIAGTAAVIFILVAKRSQSVDTRRIVKEAPWAVVVFSIGMYVVVYGLRNAGLTDMLGQVIQWTTHYGLFSATMGMGFIAAILSSIMNNMPTVMINALAIQGTATKEFFVKPSSMLM
jgi:arsenical pump membrane protein